MPGEQRLQIGQYLIKSTMVFLIHLVGGRIARTGTVDNTSSAQDFFVDRTVTLDLDGKERG